MEAAAKDSGQRLFAARAGSAEALGQALQDCRAYLLLIAEEEMPADLQAKGGASDLVQETFLEAHRDFAQFHGTSQEELKRWLRRLLLNNLATFARRFHNTDSRQVKREQPLETGSSGGGPARALRADGHSPSGQLMAFEQVKALRQAVEHLPEDYRRVIVMRYYDVLSFEEIGRRMARSKDAVDSLFRRAIKQLRQEHGGTE